MLGRILHRYIFFDLLKVFLLTTAAMTFFLAIVYALKELGDRGLGPFDAIQLVLCFVPVMLIFAMPISALLTTTLVFGKLSSENEITACRASGVSMVTVLWPVLVLGLLIGVVNFFLFDRLIPWSRSAGQEVGMKNIERIFFHCMETKKSFWYQKDFFIHAKHIEGNMLYGVVTSFTQPNGQRYEATAPAAYVRFYPWDEMTDRVQPRPPRSDQAVDANGKKKLPTAEEFALSKHFDDVEVVPRGRVVIQLFGVYASDQVKTKKLIGNPSLFKTLREVHKRQPSQMTLGDLRQRYSEPEKTFDYQFAVASGAGAAALAKYRQTIQANTLAEMHSRYATIFSCVLLVGLGAALGTYFRHGHILTAFAVSMGPGLFAIFSILLGVKLVTNSPAQMHSLVWVIWLGNAAVAALDAYLIGRLLRQ